MRLWHVDLLEFLPKLQFDGQLRELVSIMRDVRDKGKTNHLLINRVMEYPKADLYGYFLEYAIKYEDRYGKLPKQTDEFREFGEHKVELEPFKDWHNKEYLRVCVCNLYEKYHFGVGKSKISQEEWNRVLQGYKEITGEDWVI